MNKTYRTVWNPTTGTWVAAAETARARKKSNSTMRSSVTAAVAVMAGVGGGGFAVEAGAQTAANGNGGLALCGPTTGISLGSGSSVGNALSGCNTASSSPLYQGRTMAFALTNNSSSVGSSSGNATPATLAGISGSKSGHLVLHGGAGVHITGATDFANAVSMTNNRIQNLAAGTAGTDAVNLNQLNAAIAATDDKYVNIRTGVYAADVAASANESATAIGANASATGISAVALGGNTVASANNGVAIGTLARATALETTAVGVGAAATGQNSSVLGRGAAANAGNSVALGAFSVADRANSVSVGTATSQRQITNVAAGTAGTDAVNVNQLNAAIAASDPYFMVNSTSATHANATGANAVAIGQNVTSSGSSSVALGSGTAAAGFHSVAIGASASTVGDSNVALGDGAAVAQSHRFVPTNGVAIGTNARVIDGDITGATGSIAIGNSATAGGTGTIAIGTNARHTGSGATVLGSNASAMGGGAGVAVGSGSSAAGSSSVAMGPNATSTGTGSIAIGSQAATTINNSVAIGNAAAGSAINTTAIGSNARATGDNATVLGQSGAASGLGAIGLGFRANAQADRSVAIGMDSVADRNNTVSVGSATQQRQITNLAAGTAATDAVNVAQLNAAIANVGGNSPYVKANGAGDGSDDASATGVGSVAIGSNAKTLVDGGVAVGRSATAGMANSVAIGNDAVASQDGVAIGRDARAQNANAISIGAGSAAGQNGTSLGNSALAGPYALALGTNASATGNNSVALGNGSVALADNTVSVGSAGNERKIVNVADGTLSATSKDAVNGAQLFATNTRVGSLEDSLARGGVIDPVTGESLAVVYDSTAKDKITLGGGTAGTTLANVKAGVADTDAVNVSQLKGSGLIGDDGSAIAAVTYNRNADGTPNYDAVTLGGGKSTGPVTLSNVADGVNRNDAVNLGQLQDSGLVAPVDPTNPGAGVTSLAVTYGKNADGSANFDEVKLKGTNGTTLANVKAGVADTDAVNVSQLKGSGLVGDDGKAIAAVTYNRNADGTPNYNAVTLGGGKSAGPVTLSNVATGVAATDAVNVQQLQQTVANGNPYIGGRGTGVAAQATGLNAIALGLGSVADEIRTVSVGNSATGLQRRITNVQNGEADSDAATVGQVNDLMGIASTNAQVAIDSVNTTTKQAIQDVNSRLDAIGTLAGTDPYVQVDGLGDGSDNASVRAGTYGVAIGAEASATGDTAIAIGAQSRSTGSGSVALGAGASATGTGAVAFGSGVATGTSALALGNGTNASGNNAVAAGFNARAAGVNALALGNTARANAADSLAFGTSAQVDPLATNSIAIGRQSSVTGTALNSVALGASSVADRLNSVSVGSTGQQRQIIYVARGTANTDAVNVSQLKDAVAAFGGNASVGADGSIVNPTYTIGGTTYRNVGDALDALSALGGGGGSDPLAVTYGKNSDGTPNFEVVTLKGADGTTLSNVKAGVADKDAVNVSQLKDSGLIGGDGKAIAAVTYDRNADGTPNYRSVTLGDGTNPTQLKHVANATEDSDALNLGQLKDAGLVGNDGSGNLTSLAVTYDSATKDKVTLGGGTAGTTLTNVKAGVADADAVNVSQLKGSGLIGDDGKAIAAVTYNRNPDGSPNYDAVTLGGGKSAGPVTLSNVADGVNRNDAVNLGQLQDSGLVAPIDPTNPGAGVTSLAVTYGKNTDGSANYDEVKLKGTSGTTLTNVKAGVADADAVNVSQLKGSGLIGDDGKAIAAVTYDRNPDGSPNYDAVTLGGGKSAGPVQVKNVAAGTDDTDAVNVAQLKDAGLVAPVDPTNPGAGVTSLAVTYSQKADGTANYDEVKLKGANGTTLTNVKAGAVNAASTDAVNGSQLYGVSKSVADSLGGGSAVDANGNVTAPTYSLTDPANAAAKVDYRNVGDALGNLDGRVATNTQNITVINNQLADSGLVDPVTGQSIAAVTYDRNANGTPNYNAVTLGGGKSAGPVQLKNVAAGTDDTDAVNVAQLKDAGLVAPVDPTNPGAGVTSLAVTYGTNADGSANFDEVKLKGTNGTTLTNVAAGAVNATSTDAINGSQLHGTAQSVADTLGGGTTVDADGKLANASFEVKGNRYATVEQAIQAAAAYGATDSLAVRYDLNADGTPNYGSVTLGGTGAAPVKLTNVADGASQYDAVNFGQLSALNDKIGDLDGRVGGLELRPGNPGDGNGGGTGTNPYFGATDQTTGGSSAANPGTGTGNVAAGSGSSIGTGVNDGTAIGSGSTVAAGGGTAIGAGSAAKGENATAIGQGSNATGSGSVAIGSGAVANEANTVSFGDGTDTGNRRIVNIADGINANDGATKGQLDRAVGGLAGQINDVSKNAYSGIAAATALTMIPGVDPGKTLSFGVGGATYKGYQAVAFGGEARITQNLKMKAGVGLSSGGNTVGVGASYQW